MDSTEQVTTLWESEPKSSLPSQIPDGWTLCIHPQGWIYFHHPALNIVTDFDIRDPHYCSLISTQSSLYPTDYLKLNFEVHFHVQAHALASTSTAPAAFNLIINHTSCVASYNIEDILEETVANADPNIVNRQRRLYWNYVWNHPAHLSACPPRALQDASDALIWFYTDNLITGANSVAPFSKQECEELTKIVKDLRDSASDTSVPKIVFLSWLLREVCSFRDAENWGLYTQKEARELSRQRRRPALSDSPGHAYRPAVNLIIKYIFFGIPWTYLAHVKSSFEYRGRLANMQHNWEGFITRLAREYTHFLLISTVLLSATVGLLAVPEINKGTLFCATLSAFASLSSIIVGVFSIWRHQANTTTTDSYTYMRNAQHNLLGLHGHAILLSLPAVFLVWAVLTFMIAMLAYTLQDIDDPDPLHRLIAWVTLVLFIFVLLAVVAALHTFSMIWSFRHRHGSWLWQRLTSIPLIFQRRRNQTDMA